MRFEIGRIHRLKHFLGQRQRECRRSSQFLRQRQRIRFQFRIGHHAIDKTPLTRFFRRQHARGVNQFFRARDTEALHQKENRAAVGNQTYFLEDLGEFCGVRSDNQIARHRD